MQRTLRMFGFPVRLAVFGSVVGWAVACGGSGDSSVSDPAAAAPKDKSEVSDGTPSPATGEATPPPAAVDGGTTPPGPPPASTAACDESTRGGGGPNGGPADLFPCDSPWYTDVTSAPVAPQSDGIISSIGNFGSGAFRIDFNLVFMHADAATARHKFAIDYTDDSNTDPVPVPAGGALEQETGYTCDQGGDCHLIVVDDAKKQLFELWSVQNALGPYIASQETMWDLTKHYGVEGRGLGCTSADAAGLAIMPGMIGLRETRAGLIRHALRFILPNSKIRKGPSYVAPATHGTNATSSSAGPAYGSRLRLKSTFDETKVKSSGGKAVVRALKTYGMLLADGGSIALTAESDRLEKVKDPTMTWTDVLDAADLTSIKPADFEVLEFSAIKTSIACTLK